MRLHVFLPKDEHINSGSLIVYEATPRAREKKIHDLQRQD